MFLLAHSVTSACRSSEYECTDTQKCIAKSYLCDGTPDDCDNGEDEDTQICEANGITVTTCTNTEYECKDGSGCIDISMLCDTFKDCDNGEDETEAICEANNICTYSNGCINRGYDYRCEYSGKYATHCLYEYKMCDSRSDCPNGDDEIQANCDISTPTTTTFGGSGTEGIVTCGQTITAMGEEDSIYFYNFTFPSQYTHLKITNCFSTNQGDADLALCPNGDFNDCMYPSMDYSCSGCSYRITLLGVTDGTGDDMSTYNVTKGKEYAIGTQIYFTGTYAFKVECATSSFTAGGVCTDSAWPTFDPITTDWAYNPSSTFNWPITSNSGYNPASTDWTNNPGTTYSWNGMTSTFNFPRRRMLAASAPFCVTTKAPTAPTEATSNPSSNPTPSPTNIKVDQSDAYRTKWPNVLFIFMSFVLYEMLSS